MYVCRALYGDIMQHYEQFARRRGAVCGNDAHKLYRHCSHAICGLHGRSEGGSGGCTRLCSKWFGVRQFVYAQSVADTTWHIQHICKQ